MEQNKISVSEIENILKEVKHPAHKQDIVSLNIVEKIIEKEDGFVIYLAFASKDPLSASIKKVCEFKIVETLPTLNGKVTIFVKEMQRKNEIKKPESLSSGVKNIIAVSSAKGGVGKSTVTANIAATYAKKGYKVGVLDADIYGPSIHLMFDLDGYKPAGEVVNGVDAIIPAESRGVKIMSIGFFIDPSDALVWRGPMATNALKQMIHQTKWDDLDYLFVDMPPGTGDVHLTLMSELKVNGAIIVSTPQKVALADVIRGVNMYKADGVNIPVLGVVENMSWFSPSEDASKKYYIFGRNGCSELVEKEGLKMLGRIPLMLSENEDPDPKQSIVTDSEIGENIYSEVFEALRK